MTKTRPGKTEARSALSAVLRDAVATGTDSDSPITPRDDAAEAWQRIIDYKLVEWGRDPASLSDEGFDAPSASVISTAIQWAKNWQAQGIAPPSRVIPDPNGGIVFERQTPELTHVIHFWDNGSLEYRQFRGVRLIERHEIEAAPPTQG
jgi:hypothetical protein